MPPSGVGGSRGGRGRGRPPRGSRSGRGRGSTDDGSASVSARQSGSHSASWELGDDGSELVPSDLAGVGNPLITARPDDLLLQADPGIRWDRYLAKARR